MIRAASALVLVGALVMGARASAQVAVAVASSDDDPAQRDIAAAVVQRARARWQMLAPQLTAARVKSCKMGDTACLRKLAGDAGASHLLVIGVAPLGVRDHVVAVQLFAVPASTPLFEESVVQPGALDDVKEVTDLARKLVEVPGPPAYEAPVPHTAPTPEEPGMSGLALTGIGVVSLGAVVAATAGIAGGVFVEQREPTLARNVFFYGLITSGVLAAAGTTLLVVDDL